MSYQLELRHLRYFTAVAEELHFRRAAERLFISQPGLSRQIKSMEEGIGVKLFERNNRRVSLTKAGEFLNQKLSKQLREMDGLISQAQLLNDGLLGDLKLGYVGSAMQHIIPKVLLAFRKCYPNIHFSLKEMENTQQLKGLLAKEIDVGFVRLDYVPEGIETAVVLTEPFCLVLAEDHPLDKANFTSLSALKEESFILFDQKYSPSYHKKVMDIFEDSGFTPKVTHHTIHSNSIYKLVEHHFGVSIVPKSLQVDHIKGVKFIELKQIEQQTNLSVIWKTTNQNPILLNFIDQIKQLQGSQ